ncbi:MAG: hypothetical protein Q7J45_00350 [bacterium]|nr:hypothetical protein [bacterium]
MNVIDVMPFVKGMDNYIPFMGDAQMGAWMMLVASIVIGALYGFQIQKYGTWRPLRFRTPLRAAMFIFYVGSLMSVSSVAMSPRPMIGPYAHLAYGVVSMAFGLLYAAISASVCIVLSYLLEISSDTLRKIYKISRNAFFDILGATAEWFDTVVERYYVDHIQGKKKLTLLRRIPDRKAGSGVKEAS